MNTFLLSATSSFAHRRFTVLAGAALTGALVLASSIAMAGSPLRGLIDADALKARLSTPELVVLDIRSGETREAGAAIFAASHIPGAVHGDYAHASWRLPRGKISVDLPKPAQFEALAGDLGISNDSHVVIVHEGNDATSFGAAARVYWTFKSMGHVSVAVLDGGWQGWTTSGANPVKTGTHTPLPAIYEAKLDPRFRASIEEVVKINTTHNATLIDSRPESYFSGLEKHRAVTRFGHVPGAVNIPHTQAIGLDFKVRDHASLAKEFARAGEGPVVTYCNTGHWAATGWFILSEVLGRKDVKMYEGSMIDYANENRGPVISPRAGDAS